MPNPARKTRHLRNGDQPYITLSNGSWTWKVLKFNSSDGTVNFATAFCDVTSPHTFGGSNLGDTYVSDLRMAMNAARVGVVQVDGLTLDQAATLLGVTPMYLSGRTAASVTYTDA